MFGRALDSILRQSGVDLELIGVNDGSTEYAQQLFLLARQCGVAGLNVKHRCGGGIDSMLYGAGARLLGECMMGIMTRRLDRLEHEHQT